MTYATGDTTQHGDGAPDALRTLADYLEASLDAGSSLIVMRDAMDGATFYLGDPSGPREDLRRRGKSSAALATQMLDGTHAGLNVLALDGTTYRFFRSFTQIDDVAAVVFTPT